MFQSKFSHYADYSNIISSIDSITNVESNIGKSLSSLSFAGDIENSVYPTTNVNDDSVSGNDSDISSFINMIDADIKVTEELMTKIDTQKNENINKINSNNQTISDNLSSISRMENEIQILLASIPTEDEPNAASLRASIHRQIANLRTKIAELKQQNEELKEENNALNRDNEELAKLYDEYQQKKTEKNEVYEKLNNIRKKIEETIVSLEGTFPDSMSGLTSEQAGHPMPIADEFEDNPTLLDRTLSGAATGYVYSRAAVSGILKEFENFRDAATYIVESARSLTADFTAETLHFLGLHGLANSLEEANNIRDDAIASWIANDSVETWNQNYYENDPAGIAVNERSYAKYDSPSVNSTQDFFEDATRVGEAVAATIFTGNPLPAAAIVGTSRIGETSENTFQEVKNPTLDDGVGHIALNGLEGSVEGYAIGQTVSGIQNIISGVVEDGGIAGYARHLRNDYINSIRTRRAATLAENVKLFGNNIVNSLSSVDNAVQVAGTTAGAIDEAIQTGVTPNPQEFVRDVFNEYRTDAMIGYGGSFKTVHQNKAIVDIWQTIDNFVDSGVVDRINKRNR